MVCYKAVHQRGHTAKAGIGAGHDSFRSFKLFAGSNLPTEVRGADTLHHPGDALLAQLGRAVVIAGVDQIKTVDQAGIFRSLRLTEEEAGIVHIGGRTGGTLVDDSSPGNRNGMLTHLRNPAAVKGRHLKLARQIQRRTHQFMNGNLFRSRIFQHHPAGQCRLKEGKIQIQLCTRLLHGNFQNLCASVGLGHAGFHDRRSIQNAMVYITKIRGTAVQFQRTFPEIAPAAAAPEKRDVLRTAFAVCIVQQQAAAPALSGAAGKCLCIAVFHGCAKMKLLQQAVPGDAKQQTQILISQMKQTVFVGNHKITPLELLYLLIFTLSMRF